VADFRKLAAIAELAKRQHARENAPDFADDDFPQQAAFIRSDERLISARCPRRAGKTVGVARKLCRASHKREHSRCLYLALTRQHAKELLWPVLKQLDAQYGLNAVFNEMALTCTFPNGSTIKLAGADDDAYEMKKALGQAYDLVVVDEAGSFRNDLADMVYNILRPAMMDRGGTIVLIGTPEGVHGKVNLFYRVTTGDYDAMDPVWCLFRWSSLDNPYMRKQVEKELAEIEKTRPLYKETKGFKAMFLGEWSLDNDDLVYRFNPERNVFSELPPGKYTYLLGVDMGFNDDAAFVVFAWQPYDWHLYVVDCFKRPKMDVTAHANAIHQICRRYDISRVVIDGSNKVAVEEMRRRHDLAGLESAMKRGKFEHIDLLNDDLVQGKILIHEDLTDLMQELQGLVIDKRALQRTRKRVEHPGCPNHLCDAMLYGWRATYAYHAVPAPESPLARFQRWQETQAEEMLAEREKLFEREKAHTQGDFSFEVPYRDVV
jgi:hypothetical protein